MKNRLKQKYIYYGILVALVFFIQSIYYSDIPLEKLKETYANEFSQFIEIDGMQVHFRDEGKGFPIVLVHGTAASLHTWDKWAQSLKNNYRVIRLDLPAFGLTGPNSSGDYSIDTYAKFLDDFLIKLNVQKFYLAGNSLGGNIAWNYAAEYPEKVDKLILVDASGLPTNKPQPWIFKMAKTPVLNTLFLGLTPKTIIRKNLEQVYEDDTKIDDNLVTRYHDMALREGNRQAFIDRAKTDFKLGDSKQIDILKGIKTETLIIWGENDLWIPLDNGKRMNSLMKNSKLNIIKNSGHVPMEENPEESLNLLKAFLNEY
ncbi:alpha/beta hydrolase [Winogradskyella sp.]|uniref:alpha/beta fold hydrolase n=1 Tax=Winogradskyella sp. TaxID=1883156 RepID=UPI0025FCB89C|nr:alpha/beta hydrolase [Winogradskyella sp.]